MPSPDLSRPDTDLLEALASRGEIPLAVDDGHVASNGVDADTPAGRLQFEVYPVEDYGNRHERHDPANDVHVHQWFFDGYSVAVVHDTDADDHALVVREQTPDERATELADHGVPERRAELVALREQGLSYSDIVEATGDDGPNHRGDVSKQLQAFNRDLGQAKWLVRNADTLDLGGGR
ncbi:hypothetical protein [Halobacterium yunchengense]|uniref:hypothetical protein n=1 Tax=Halobacterium yunchengense TaxID=3108497 RepID=UPI003008690B